MTLELRATVQVSAFLAVFFTMLVIPLSIYEGMPVWAAIATDLVVQTGCWGAYLLDRWDSGR